MIAMTKHQQQDLFIEWDLYPPQRQEAMISEFLFRFRGNYTKKNFLDYLKEKLQIEGYWKKIGLA